MAVVDVPTYRLYGEEAGVHREFWLHCETIASRSSEYRWEIGLHRHDSFLQFLYIRTGSGDALLPAGTVVLKPPCIIVVPPGPVHGFRFSSDIDGFVLTLVPDRCEMARGLSTAPPWFREPAVVELQHLGSAGTYLEATIERIADDYDAHRAARDEVLEAHLMTVILLLQRHLPSDPATPAPDVHGVRVERLKALIARHHRDQWSVEAYAQMLELSATHLNRSVRRITGLSMHDLVIGRSMEEARRMLVFTDYSIRHIADSLGYGDAAYFSRCFRQRCGMAPKRYRLEARAKLRNKDERAGVSA